MKVKDLKQFLANLDDDMEVIVDGENGYGIDISNMTIKKKGMIYEDEVEDCDDYAEDMAVLEVESYIFESEDLGDVDIYVDEDELEEWQEGWQDMDEEE